VPVPQPGMYEAWAMITHGGALPAARTERYILNT
jgi:hypothetical protein